MYYTVILYGFNLQYIFVNKWSKKIEIMRHYTWLLSPIVRYLLLYSSSLLVEMEMNMYHELKDV